MRKSILLMTAAAFVLTLSGIALAQGAEKVATPTKAPEIAAPVKVMGEVVKIEKAKHEVVLKAADGKHMTHMAEPAVIADVKKGEHVVCELSADGKDLVKCMKHEMKKEGKKDEMKMEGMPK